MLISAAQITANQLNAQKSTGPVTEMGKSKVSTNAIKHGLFSKNLILADENPLEYQSVLEQLHTELSPNGILEQILIERIAISLWRQKRLIRAETAYIKMDCRPSNIIAVVNEELNLHHRDKLLREEDLIEINVEYLEWCQAALEEYKIIHSFNPFEITTLKEKAPLIFQQLLSDAGNEDEISEFLDGYDSYFADIARECRAQIEQANQKPLILELAELIRNKKSILKNDLRETFSKYQVMLDNELYKAIKALREAQEWRFKTLTVIID